MKRVLFLFFLMLLPAAADDLPTLKFYIGRTTMDWGAGPVTALKPWPASSPLVLDKNALPATHQGPAPVPAPANYTGATIVVGGKRYIPPLSKPVPQAPAPSPAAPPAPLPPGSATLHWKNGETLHGDIAAASATAVTWKTPIFEDPLQLRWDVVDRVDWPLASVQATGPFSIALRDGSFIYGDLASISADSISIHSARHGDVVLKRSEVLSVRRLRGGNLLFAGPMGDAAWTPMVNQPDGNVNRANGNRDLLLNPNQPNVAPQLATGPDGTLLIQAWNRSAFLDITLPDLVDVEFRVHSSKRPEFVLSLGGTIPESLRVETWDDELVLVVGDQFKTIRKIEDKEREVALRVCWDKQGQKCSVFTPAGELITAWQIPIKLLASNPGLILNNKGLDLSLDLLRVRLWDGKPPVKIDLKQPHVELADGRSIAGELVAGPAGSIKLQSPGQAAPASFALADVDALVVSSDPPQVTGHEAVFSYTDGTSLFGSITSIADGRAAVTTSFTTGPLMSQMDQLRLLVIKVAGAKGAAPEPPLAEQDKIRIQETTLHGKLGNAEDGSLGWTPQGGIKVSRPSKTLVSEVVRWQPQEAPPATDPSLFYLSSGDILPGTLRSMDRTGAEFDSSLMASRKLAAGELNAIEFGAPTRLNVQSFNDPGWRITKGDEKSVRRTKDGIEMDPGTAIAYPALLQSSEFSFKYPSNGFSSIRLRLFCAGVDGAHATNLLLGNTGSQFISGLETNEGQFDNQTQVQVKPGDPVTVRLKMEENQVELFVNDISQLRFPIDPAKCAGSGLIIEPAGIWGNRTFNVTLSNFSAHSIPGHTWLPEVAADIKSQVLTVPRFQKDDPPRHLLLGPNGDVLRGEVEAATDSHFGFRCGLENLDVPRDRVRAVIWLKPPDANAAAVPVEKPGSNPLDHRIPMRFNFGPVGLPQLISILQSQGGGAQIRLPEKIDPRVVPMQIGNQTVGEALENICTLFDLRYHVDKDGVIILESTTAPPADGQVSKTYWLKPDAIPATTPVQDTLTAKGITFDKDSSAQWQPKSGLLSMTNTAENQAKLTALLASDFGGSLGSPTHWLQLTSGARLALVVDKVEHDSILAHHPIYGAVKVPMSQVYIIRTSAPETNASIRSLDNWRLVNAPDPVLPEGSGESSPLLGKDAPPFTLPMLENGTFDLAAQKGQVVILDFWASWCGPCIKSLPGLIESVATFPADKVKLIGMNQGESSDQVKHFMETRGLKFPVAMDADQNVAQKYGVDAIPHTVIVGPDGKVAFVQTGYSDDGDKEISDAVKHLLEPASPANTPAKATPQ